MMWATVGALATLELLVARVTGGPVAAADVGAAAALWLALALLSRAHPKAILLPLVVYGLGLLTPVVLHLPAWHVLSLVVGALLVVVFRRRLEVRWLLGGVAACAALALLMVGVDERAWPPFTLLGGLAGVVALCLALGRWSPLLVPLALVPGWSSESWTAEGDAPDAPDVVLISIDTLRYDHAVDMESVQWLQRRGTLLQAQTPSPWTLPSMATLMTGLPPEQHGGLRLPSGYSPFTGDTLAQHYQGLGYHTAATAENPFVGEAFGFSQGFDRFRHDGGTRFAIPRVPWTKTARPVGAMALARMGILGRSPVGVARRLEDARQFVEVAEERPLFLWVHILDPHLPYAHAWDLDRSLSDRVTLATGNRLALGDTPHLELLEEGYAHEVDVVDRKLLTFLKELDPGTVVVLTSDHGEAFGEHGGWEHGHSMYQELLAVPLVISGIDILDGPAGLIDVPMTLAGLGAGQDLRAPRVAIPYTSSNPLYGDRTMRAVRLKDQKLIAGEGGAEGYDLAADPGEQSPGPSDLAPLLPPVPEGWGAVSPDTLHGLQELGYVE